MRGDRRVLAAPDDGAGDGARAALLAQEKQNFRKVRLVAAIDDIGGGRAFAGHAHIQRAVAHEGKAALGFVDLHGGNAQIENHRIGRAELRRIGNIGEGAEGGRLEMEAARMGFREIGGDAGGARVAIERQQRAVGGAQNGAGIAAGAEGAVDIVLAVLWGESGEGLGQEYRSMKGQSASGFGGLTLAADPSLLLYSLFTPVR